MKKAIPLFHVKYRVSHLVFHYAQVLMKEKTDFSFITFKISDGHLAHIDIFLKINDVVAGKLKTQPFMERPYIGYEGFFHISQGEFPLPRIDPRIPFPCPHTEPAWVTQSVVFLTYMRIIEVSDRVVRIECDQQCTV